MINKYFFVPASSKRFIDNVTNIDADYIVFDLEDAIEFDNISLAIDNLASVEVKSNYFVRYPFLGAHASEIDRLIDLGFKNYVIPKIETSEDFEEVMEYLERIDPRIIVLVENPLLLINIKDFVERYKDKLYGIALGSHDYSSLLNMEHDFENLYFARNVILNIAKAYNLLAIDVVSAIIDDEELLKKEFVSAVRMGFEGKFFIHPKQLEIFNSTEFFSKSEIEEAKAVYSRIKDRPDYSAFKLNGKVYEKPHLNRIKKIVKWVGGK